MPELPEVETTRRGIAPHITGRQVTRVIVRNPNLRWQVDAGVKSGVLNMPFTHNGTVRLRA